MTGKLQHSSVSFVRPTPNYLLIVCGALVLVCLLVGMTMAISAGNLLLTAIFLVAAISLGAFAYLNLRQVKKLATGENVKKLDWEIALPDRQRQKLNIEVRELAELLQIESEQMSDLLSAYIVAEDLALRQIQQEAKLPVMRHVQIGNVPFDGVLVKQDMITCIEVSFLVTPNINQEKINEMMQKASMLKKNFKQMNLDSKIRLLLVLVTQLDQAGEAKLRSTLVGKFKSTPVDVDIRLLDFEGLQKIYAMD